MEEEKKRKKLEYLKKFWDKVLAKDAAFLKSTETL